MSRGIESFSKAPPPARTSISVSARDGTAQTFAVAAPVAAFSRHFGIGLGAALVAALRARVGAHHEDRLRR